MLILNRQHLNVCFVLDSHSFSGGCLLGSDSECGVDAPRFTVSRFIVALKQILSQLAVFSKHIWDFGYMFFIQGGTVSRYAD